MTKVKGGPFRLRLREPLIVRSYNLGDGPDAKKAADLDRLAKSADVISCQEAADRTKVLRDWCQENGWVYFPGDGTPGAASVPILFRKSLRFDQAWTREAQPRRRVARGAGPEVAKRKTINHVRIRVGKRSVHVLNGHWYATAHARSDAYAAMTRAAAKMVRPHWRRVVFTGDFNLPASDRLLAPMRRRRLRASKPTGSTHGKRRIDLLWTRGLRVIDSSVIRNLSSDHDSPGITVR